ncbi:MAG: hypothetical protein JNM24_19360 [Bdellovibrionaceae bacterium]|nr:hypothetical protein [Pseudobdellovibrionaceae bacterium]
MKDNRLLLIGLLEVMENAVAENNRDVFFNKFYQVRNMRAESASPEIVAAFKRLLLKSIAEFNKNNTFNTIVSSIISLSYGLIPYLCT